MLLKFAYQDFWDDRRFKNTNPFLPNIFILSYKIIRDVLINIVVVSQDKEEIHVYPESYTYHIALRRIVLVIGIS
ncbi:hypothetical protein JOC86_004837 [Bacillus pakistanensis]|uniref:Uncharacterized protein n=1 Tax=Rossellomorea pakistanensis TaxID=992288 RepID=A0ABS2NK46_9BACI|nr:hypothetical protein [Bacillus pakistanensis]